MSTFKNNRHETDGRQLPEFLLRTRKPRILIIQCESGSVRIGDSRSLSADAGRGILISAPGSLAFGSADWNLKGDEDIDLYFVSASAGAPAVVQTMLLE